MVGATSQSSSLRKVRQIYIRLRQIYLRVDRVGLWNWGHSFTQLPRRRSLVRRPQRAPQLARGNHRTLNGM